MGRPPVSLTLDQVREIETLAAVLSVQQIADYFGMARSTFFALLERDPDIARYYRRGKARAIGSIAQSLIAKARSGDTTSMIFYLKTQAGWREAARIEANAGEHPEEPDARPMIDVTRLSDGALAELAALMDDESVPEPPRPRQSLIRRD